jgi:RNA polymerase sigma-54 factor
VRAVLRVLQAQEPVGIGARHLRECLSIQIAHLEERGLSHPHALEVVTQFLTELGEHKFGRIAHELKISQQEVADVWEFVKTKLNPHPAHGFSSITASPPPRSRPSSGVEATSPSPLAPTNRAASRGGSAPAGHAARLRAPVGAAMNPTKSGTCSSTSGGQTVHRNINQRRQTLFNITRCLVDQQRDFSNTASATCAPCPAAVAQELGVHESTVSRATAQKYVMLPNGEVIPYAHFFTPSLSVKDIMKEVIEKEGKPLTDSEIVERLKDKGIHIARRTVAKYRMQLAILPSSLR